MLPFSKEDLMAAVLEGTVTQRPHPDLPFYIYNYSPEVQYSNKWNDVTLNCRGLILDNEFNIVARPWKKFFNLGQVDLPIQLTDPVEVMDKADGSLGILYPAGDGYAISTRGSFISDQAIHATRVWEDRYSHLHPLTGYTILFEIVYPENRIVLNYDGMDDLILLGAVENATGYYYGPRQAKFLFTDRGHYAGVWSGPVVEVFEYKNISEALGHMDRPNAEGYVIRSHNFLVKLKQPDYLDLHRLVSNMTPKTIWEKLRDGKSVSEICGDLPDEFHSMAEGFAEPLLEKYDQRFVEILRGFSDAQEEAVRKYGLNMTRKQVASVFTKSRDSKYYFSLLDRRSIKELLWAELKPREAAYEDAKALLHSQ